MTRASEPLTDEQLAQLRAFAQTGGMCTNPTPCNGTVRELALRLLTEHAAQAERVREMEAECRVLREYHTSHRAYVGTPVVPTIAVADEIRERFINARAAVEAHDARAAQAEHEERELRGETSASDAKGGA